RFLLPERAGGEDPDRHFRLEDYLTEITILPDSPFLKKTIADIESEGTYHFTVMGLIRRGRRLRAPFKNEPLQGGDVLVVRTTPEELVSIRKEAKVELHPVRMYGKRNQRAQKESDNEDDDGSALFVQALVAPRSDLVGCTLGEIDFRRSYGAIVVGVWRKDGW